jgi:multiple sugar transport system permease protein
MKRLESIRVFFRKPEGAAYLFILPACLTLLLFIVAPLVMAMAISCLDLTIFLNSPMFVGLGNFKRLVADPRFWNALKNTFVFLVFQMPLQVILGLLAAAFLSENSPYKKTLRSIYFLPTVCSLTAMGIVWSFLLDPNVGMIPYYLEQLGLPKMLFLRDPKMAMPSVIAMTAWKNFGMTMVIFVAGIQGIPRSYYEAAELDGAVVARRFFAITVPLLVPTIGFCVITNTIGSLQVFDQIYVMTGGGPLFSTETLVLYIYDVGFKSQPFELSYASALAVVLFILIMAISLGFKKYFAGKETVDL